MPSHRPPAFDRWATAIETACAALGHPVTIEPFSVDMYTWHDARAAVHHVNTPVRELTMAERRNRTDCWRTFHVIAALCDPLRPVEITPSPLLEKVTAGLDEIVIV